MPRSCMRATGADNKHMTGLIGLEEEVVQLGPVLFACGEAVRPLTRRLVKPAGVLRA